MMGEGFQFIDIILLAMVAGFIALRLRSVLGRRTGDESGPATDSVPSGRRMPGEYDQTPGVDAGEPSDTVVRLEADPKLRKGFREIGKADPDFDVDVFLEGAKAVYPIVLDAFWNGDRDTLSQYLSEDVLSEFDAALDARQKAAHAVEGRVVDLTGAEIVEAGMNGGMAEITLRYTAEIVSVTRDSEGSVVEGDVSDTTTVTDVWTFQREAGSDDPNWTLIATSSE